MIKDLVANIYELWGVNFLGAFSQDMFQNDIYLPIMLYTVLVSIFICILYYYIIDRPKTGKLWVWLIFLLAGGIFGFLIAYITSTNNLIDIYAQIGQDLPLYQTDILLFSMTNAFYTLLFIFILSILFKLKSTHSSNIPF